jgi:hypothetical protein
VTQALMTTLQDRIALAGFVLDAARHHQRSAT